MVQRVIWLHVFTSYFNTCLPPCFFSNYYRTTGQRYYWRSKIEFNYPPKKKHVQNESVMLCWMIFSRMVRNYATVYGQVTLISFGSFSSFKWMKVHVLSNNKARFQITVRSKYDKIYKRIFARQWAIHNILYLMLFYYNYQRFDRWSFVISNSTFNTSAVSSFVNDDDDPTAYPDYRHTTGH